jgi:hypothetical protein
MKKSPRTFLRSRILLSRLERLVTVVFALATYFSIRQSRARRGTEKETV